MRIESFRSRIGKVCTEVILRKTSKASDSVRQLIDAQHSSEPNLSTFRIRQNNKRKRKYLSNVSELNSNSETALDCIIRELKPSWPKDLLLLITPSSRCVRQYKLYIIDRGGYVNGRLVGITHITDTTLNNLSFSEAFQNHCIVLGSCHINLNTISQRRALITNLINNLNGNCNIQQRTIKTASTPHNTLKYCEALSQKQKNHNYHAVSTSAKQCPQPLQDTRLLALIERINAVYEPKEKDIRKLFQLAEKYEFTLYVHPEFGTTESIEWECDKNSITSLQSRFHVECFLPFFYYVGSIIINGTQLQRKLQYHPNLLPRVNIVDDVCELTPLPTFVIKCLRTAFACFGLEIFYDVLGKFLFELYKQYTRKRIIPTPVFKQ